MNKKELVNVASEKAEMTKKDAEVVVNALLESITEALSEDEKVAVHGFGSFDVRHRAARKGRNPQDGSELDIPASKTVGFKPAKKLKQIVKES